MGRLITSKMHQKLPLRIDIHDFACISLRSKERHTLPHYIKVVDSAAQLLLITSRLLDPSNYHAVPISFRPDQ